MDETRLYFAVTDFGDDPEIITRLLGVTPTRVVIRGVPRPDRPRPPAREELWALDSRLPGSASFETHLDGLLTELERNPGAVQEVAARYDVGFQCHSHFETCNPGFALPSELVRRVAALGLGFDFDLYVFPEDETDG